MSADFLIYNAQLITPTGRLPHGWLLTRDARIAALGAGELPDFEMVEMLDADGQTLLPGFIDVHVHGAVGADTMDATPEALQQMAAFYAQHGVTGFLATTWTDSRERITAALMNIAAAQRHSPNGAAILGAHLEGPYLNPAKGGAQNTEHLRRADREEALAFLDIGVIRLLALAPEYDENHWLIRECVRRGITVSAAHTAATYTEMRHAVDLGLTQTTHTFNAMTGLHHREPGTVGAALTSPEICCEVIADNIHVHPAVMQVLYAAKGIDGVILISDAVRGAGMPDGDYHLDARTVTVRDGAVRLPDGTLAGSTLTLDRAVANFIAATGAPLTEIWRAASLNPARALGLAAQTGSIEIGKAADLILVDDNINVHLTMVGGQIAFRRNMA
ncbi:MAG: N-acetylglucosamine-6-phosphate deacetylase [Chloroflexi bacterium]|nr:N-acetylglucosamine-6-phosphate deacetylase [Chloroflexota bacterium]